MMDEELAEVERIKLLGYISYGLPLRFPDSVFHVPMFEKDVYSLIMFVPSFDVWTDPMLSFLATFKWQETHGLEFSCMPDYKRRK